MNTIGKRLRELVLLRGRVELEVHAEPASGLALASGEPAPDWSVIKVVAENRLGRYHATGRDRPAAVFRRTA